MTGYLMGIKGTVFVEKEVVAPKSVSIALSDAGEVRRLGRILLAFLEGEVGRGAQTDAFAQDLIAAAGYNEANTAKQA